jgi:Mg-chelatase subunit ChlD
MRNLVLALGLVTASIASLLSGSSGCADPGSVGSPTAEDTGGSVSNAGAGGDSAGGAGGGGTMAAGDPTVVIQLDAAVIGVPDTAEDTTPPPPTVDVNCGSVTSTATRRPADVLLVLDRSRSMEWSTDSDENCRQGATNCVSRWPALTSAVTTTLGNTADTIHWGLKLYSSPGGSSCTVNAGVEVPVAASSIADIEAEIASATPSNNTPTAQAIEAATAYLATLDDPNDKYILLATDGEPNCAPGQRSTTTNVQGTVDAIAAATAAGFPTYVIGIGPSVGNLDNFAAAGGTGNYYPATSPESLTDAFASISELVATCTFTSDEPAPDPDNVAVYLNKKLVPEDDVDGWSLGSDLQTITLHGAACDEAMSASGSSVQILFGCPGGPPPPQFIP